MGVYAITGGSSGIGAGFSTLAFFRKFKESRI